MKNNIKDLRTSEIFILLAIHPAKGNIRTNHISFKYGLIGAMLIDLVECGKIEINNERIKLLDFKRGSDKVVNSVLGRIWKSKKEKKISTWIIKLSNQYRYYKKEFLHNMKIEGIIRIEQRRFFNIIPYKRYIIKDSKVQTDLISSIRESVLERRAKLSEDNTRFMALLKVCNFSKAILSKEESKEIKKELSNMVKQYPIVKAVSHVIKQMHAAAVSVA